MWWMGICIRPPPHRNIGMMELQVGNGTGDHFIAAACLSILASFAAS